MLKDYSRDGNVITDFKDYMSAVDKELHARCGMGHMDLPDVDYYGMFDSEVCPLEAAETAMDEAMDGMDFL